MARIWRALGGRVDWRKRMADRGLGGGEEKLRKSEADLGFAAWRGARMGGSP